MDKEAQERIAHIIADNCYRYYDERRKAETNEDYFSNYNAFLEAEQVFKTLKELGYRKLPKDKPPLLGDEGIDRAEAQGVFNTTDPFHITAGGRNVAKAQREADIKHYEHSK